MPEPTTFRIFRSPEGFALPFSTYLPDVVVADASAAGEGEAVRFVANFGGQRREAIYLSLHVPPEGTTASEAQQRAREVAESLGSASADEEPRYPWALASYGVRVDATTASVALGRHAGRFFYLVSHAPSEALDGWGPRSAHILREWRWADGSMLGS